MLNAVAPLNIADMFVTWSVFQPLTSWLKAVAPWNMDVRRIVVAEDPGVQPVSVELNAVAPWNIEVKFVTKLTFQRFPEVFILEFETPAAFPLLKDVAFKNIELIFVAACVSQLLKSWLKRVAPENIEEKFVTELGLQLEILTSLNVEAPENAKLRSVTEAGKEVGTLESEVQLKNAPERLVTFEPMNVTPVRYV